MSRDGRQNRELCGIGPLKNKELSKWLERTDFELKRLEEERRFPQMVRARLCAFDLFESLDIVPVRLRPGTKIPMDTHWERGAPIPSVHAWIESWDGDENIGGLMGEPSGWVVDIDLDDAEAVRLAPEFLPPTRTFGRKSARRSHYLYRVKGAQNRVWTHPDDKRHLVNLRSTGNQTMMPGSVHPCGEAVEWENDLPIAAIEAHELTHQLDQLARRCGYEPKPERVVERKPVPRPAAGARGYGPAALAYELDQLARTAEGGRNHQLNLSAFSVAQLVDMGELPASALDEVRAVALQTGLEPGEVERTMASAIDGAARNPRPPLERHEPPAREPHREAPKPALPDPGGLVAELVRELARTQGRTHGGIAVPGFPLLTEATFGLRGTCLFTGPSGMGKTTMVNAIAVNVARGCDYTGSDRCEPVPVVYFTAEMTRTEITVGMAACVSAVPVTTLIKGEPGESPTDEGLSAPLWLGWQARERVERALHQLDQLDRSRMLTVLSAREHVGPWVRGEGHALQGLEDAVRELHPGRRVLVIVDTLATLDIRPAEGERHRTDLDADADIVDALVAWRSRLDPDSCILAVHEESKAATGTGDGHAVRGSSRYMFSCSQRIALMPPTGENGTRSLGLRDGDMREGVAEMDMVVAKARRGGVAGTIIAMEHEYHRAHVTECARFSIADQAEARRERRAARGAK